MLLESDVVYGAPCKGCGMSMFDCECSSAVLCEHANEVPGECKCSDNCYCKTHTCKPKESKYLDKSELRKITHGELILMFTRLAIDVSERPENYIWGENMEDGIDEFFRQENFRRDLLKDK